MYTNDFILFSFQMVLFDRNVNVQFHLYDIILSWKCLCTPANYYCKLINIPKRWKIYLFNFDASEQHTDNLEIKKENKIY